jgi:hypothetical protein
MCSSWDFEFFKMIFSSWNFAASLTQTKKKIIGIHKSIPEYEASWMGFWITVDKRLGMALHLWWLLFRRTDSIKPRSKLPITVDNCSSIFFFNASLQIMPGNGKDILFWSDPWLQGSWIGDRWLDIVTAVPLRRRKKLTLEKARQGGAWIRDITRALVVPIILQYLDARQHINSMQLQPDLLDQFSWHWTTSGQYTSKSAYEAFFTREWLVRHLLVHISLALQHLLDAPFVLHGHLLDS